MAKDFTELVAWQLAVKLEDFVVNMTRRPALTRDRVFCAQANDAAESAPRNIAEGFGRFAPKEFAQYMRIAIGSELETRNQILEAARKGAITPAERDEGVLLTRRAVTAALRLRRYLRSSRARANAGRIENSRNAENP
jgi:four helix bundle protein